MEKIKNKVNKYKYFWYYPKNKSNIVLVAKGDNNKELKNKVINKISKKDNNTIVLIKLKFKDKPSKLLPGNVIVSFEEYEIKNNKIKEPHKSKSGAIYFDTEYLKENGFKYQDLKKIVKKVFLENSQIDPFGEYFADL